MRRLGIAAAVLWLQAGCSTGPPICTQVYVWGLQVHVVRSSTGALICDAIVTASDGAYREQLKAFSANPDGADCTYYGAGERAGTYTIDVVEGSSRKTVSGIVVDHDECHVVTRQVALDL